MTKKQILDFVKAPFSKSFIIAYLFSFFSLFAVPLIYDIVSVVLSNLDKIESLSQNEAADLLLEMLKNQVHYTDVMAAIVGIFISFLLLSLYYFLLVHKTVVENKEVFDVSKISLSMREILSVLIKYLSFILIFWGGFLLPLLVTTVLFLIGSFLPRVLAIVTFIFCFFLFFFMLYKVFCHLYTASFIFYKEFNLSIFFNRKKVKTFFGSHKQNIFISFLLSYVLGQMIYITYSSICLNLLQKIFSFGLFFEAFHSFGQIVIAIGLCVFNFTLTYLTILQAIILGKIILWVEKSDANKLA